MADFGLAIQLEPDVIKIDLAVTRGIDRDPVRRHLAKSLVALAERAEAAVVAEGIETPHELTAVSQLGVRYGQGYWLARPGSFAQWVT